MYKLPQLVLTKVKGKMISEEKYKDVPVTITMLKFPGSKAEWVNFPLRWVKLYKEQSCPSTMVTEAEYKKHVADKKAAIKAAAKAAASAQGTAAAAAAKASAKAKGAAAAAAKAAAKLALAKKRKLEQVCGHMMR